MQYLQMHHNNNNSQTLISVNEANKNAAHFSVNKSPKIPGGAWRPKVRTMRLCECVALRATQRHCHDHYGQWTTTACARDSFIPIANKATIRCCICMCSPGIQARSCYSTPNAKTLLCWPHCGPVYLCHGTGMCVCVGNITNECRLLLKHLA